MTLLLTGICGFVGSSVARALCESGWRGNIVGVDNLGRSGSEQNRQKLRSLGIKVFHGDIRNRSDVEALPAADWIIDCAANASVLAGADGSTSSRQLMEHNLGGTINLLEKCRANKSGFILMSTSRVYSIPPLASMTVVPVDGAYEPSQEACGMPGFSMEGIAEDFSTAAPVSLYGATKLASEMLALEYGRSFNFPVWINRCGVLAGAGQFGRADQGIFSYWLNSHLRRRPLRYIGFDGMGHQVRDCLHPKDLVPLLIKQTTAQNVGQKPQVTNIAGGTASTMSLRQMTAWCDARFGSHAVASDPTPRNFDLPWVVLDSSLARQVWDWTPMTSLEEILAEIALHAESNPEWLELSAD